MSHEAVEAFLQEVTDEVTWTDAQASVRVELADHIAAHAEALAEEGLAPEEAERMAVAAMGEAKSLGQSLNGLHRPQVDWGLLGLAAALLLAGLVNLWYCSQQGYHLAGIVGGVSLGVLAAILIYIKDYSRSAKWWPAVYALAWGIYAVSPSLLYSNWRIQAVWGTIALLQVLLFVWAIAGAVYELRNKGLAGLVCAGLLATVSLWPILTAWLASTLVVGVLYVGIFTMAINWGYFGGLRRRNLAVAYSAVGAVLAALALYIIPAPWRLMRLKFSAASI